MKVPVLVLANIRRFLRDWQSVLILVGFPLLIVAGIYWGFSPNQIDTPIGTIDNSENFEYGSFEDSTEDFARLENYSSLDGCISDLKKYRIYACTVFEDFGNSTEIRVYYDNTREVIDQNIINQLRDVTGEMQSTYVEETASRFINRSGNLAETFRDLENRLNETQDEIDSEIERIDDRINDIRESRDRLENNSLQGERLGSGDIEESSEEFGEGIETEVREIDRILVEIENSTQNQSVRVLEAKRRLSSINNLTTDYLSDLNQDLEEIEDLNSDLDRFESFTENYSSQLNSSIRRLRESRASLLDYRNEVVEARNNFSELGQRYSRISSLDPANISTGIKSNERRVYSGNTAESGLRVMKTIYSTLLILVCVFVSLLVGMFVTLNDINSLSRKRLDVTPGTFVAEYISIYISSIIIITVPILAVLLVGEILFRLPIFSNILDVSVIVLLFCSSVITLSMLVAYLIRNKGITLLVGSFLLVFMIFFSGFVMPLQMMDQTVRSLASPLPGNVAQKAFDSVVLYEQDLSNISGRLYFLTFWFFLFGLLGIYVKSGKKYVKKYLRILLE